MYEHTRVAAADYIHLIIPAALSNPVHKFLEMGTLNIMHLSLTHVFEQICNTSDL